jgi:hypothetical protein
MRVEPLLASHIDSLGGRIREEDLMDCAQQDYNPFHALWDAKRVGPCWAVLDGDHVMGAAGFSAEQGTIWSLWAEDLTGDHKRWIMQHTQAAVRMVCAFSGCPTLGNYVWEGNRLTIAWLRASKCFTFEETLYAFKGNSYLHFTTKPLGELPDV